MTITDSLIGSSVTDRQLRSVFLLVASGRIQLSASILFRPRVSPFGIEVFLLVLS